MSEIKDDQDKILIIEDEKGVARLLEILFGKNGFAVTVVGLIADSQDMLDKQQFDAIVSDQNLPDGTGLAEILRRSVNQLPNYQTPKWIFSSDIKLARQAAEDPTLGNTVEGFFKKSEAFALADAVKAKLKGKKLEQIS